MEIGQKIKLVRQDRLIKQNELAKLIGWPNARMSLIENGQCNPSFKAVEKIAEAFGMTILEFLQYNPKEEEKKVASIKVKMPPNSEDYIPIRKEREDVVAKILGKLLSYLKNVESVEDELGISSESAVPFVHPYVSQKNGAQMMAHILREYLGIGSGTIPDIAALFAFHNIRILTAKMPQNIQSLSFWNKKHRILSIVLREGTTPERQTYRLVYELGSACLFVSKGYKQLEETSFEHHFLRDYTAAFLMPEETIRSRIAALGITSKTWTFQLICTLKYYFNVSAEAFTFRLKALSLITSELFDEIILKLRDYYNAHPTSKEPKPHLSQLKFNLYFTTLEELKIARANEPQEEQPLEGEVSE